MGMWLGYRIFACAHHWIFLVLLTPLSSLQSSFLNTEGRGYSMQFNFICIALFATTLSQRRFTEKTKNEDWA